MFVEAIGEEQTIARSELPLVPPSEGNGDRAAVRNALFALQDGLDECLGRVDIRIGKIHAQAVSGAGPESAALIFAEIAHAGAGHAFFDAVLHPIALGKAIEVIVTGDPNTAVAGANHRVDAIETVPQDGPIPAIKFPYFVTRRAPDFAIGNFGKAKDGFGS